MSKEFIEVSDALRKATRAGVPLVRSLERKRLWAYVALLLSDIIAIFTAFLLAGWVYEGLFPHPTNMLQSSLLVAVYVTLGLYNSTYSLRVLEDFRHGILKAASTLLVSTLLLNFILFYAKSNAAFSRIASALGLITAFALLIAIRLTLAWVVRLRWREKVANVLVISDGGPSFGLPGAVAVDAATSGLDPASQDPHFRDRLGRILLNQDKVIVSCPTERRAEWALALKTSGVTGEVLSQPAYDVGAIGLTRYDDCGASGLVVAMGPLGLRARALKRLFDIAAALFGLVLAMPLLVIVALAVKLQDSGPVLFSQQRMGRGNRIFRMFKFRTMRVDASDQAGSHSTQEGDGRVTPVGRILRRTSIDELPQLWNVLRGDMSIVGPRPHALGSLAGEKLFWEVDARYWHRHTLRPGLTGLAQVRGLRGATDTETDLAVRLQADLEYIARWNLLRDIGIVMRTLLVLVHRRAY